MAGAGSAFQVSEEHRRQFRDAGYCIFEDAVSADLLAMLRAECAESIRREDEKMDRLGVDQLGITHRGQRYHAAFPVRERPIRNDYLCILPMNQSGIRSWVPHEFDPPSDDWVGYSGPLNGLPVQARAGTLAAFSSVTLHSSGANTTPKLRRAYIAQYSPEPVLTADRKMLWGNAVPFLRGGKSVIGEPVPDLPFRIDHLAHGNERLKASGRTRH
jgi:ectoine hydroxylase-related dioxygenase (phytanoyl-CoA dioxygenase family)